MNEKDTQPEAQSRKSGSDTNASPPRVLRFSPAVTIAIVTALFGFAGAVVGKGIEGIYSVRLEQWILRKELILEAIRTPSQDEAEKTLRFLVRSGLLEDHEGKLAEALSEPSTIPNLTPLESRVARLEIQLAALECQMEGKAFNLSTLRCTDVPAQRRSGAPPDRGNGRASPP